MMIPSTLAKAICVTVGALYPSYATFKAIKTSSREKMAPWMMYWSVFGIFTACEFIADTLLYWLPLYDELKIATILWLVLPQTQATHGALMLYRKFVHPFLSAKESEIDGEIAKAGTAVQRMRTEAARHGAAWTTDMRHVAAYLLATLGGNANPSQADVNKILSSVGIESDEACLKAFLSSLSGKDIHQVMAEGMAKLASVPSGAGAAPTAACKGGAASAAAAAPAAGGKKDAPKEEKPESDEEMGFGLFD